MTKEEFGKIIMKSDKDDIFSGNFSGHEVFKMDYDKGYLFGQIHY